METYKLICHKCGKTIIVPTKPPQACPRCAAPMVIEWKPANLPR